MLIRILLSLSVALTSLHGNYVVSACNNNVNHSAFAFNYEVNVNVTTTFDENFGTFRVVFGDNAGIFAGADAVSWCADLARNITSQSFLVDMYSTYNTTGIPTGAVDKPENLDLLNYLVNTYSLDQEVSPGNGCAPKQLTWAEIQEAIWRVVDYETQYVGAQQCIVDYIVDDTMTNGNNYEPCCDSNDKLAVMLIIDDDDDGGQTTGNITHQVIISEVRVSEISTACPNPGAQGDPHFKTWTGEMYDFHGVCDLVLLQNPAYKNGIGMDIHLRTRKTRTWSYISAAVIRIGEETLEVMGGEQNLYWLNGVAGDEELLSTTISGHSIQYRNPSKKTREFEIYLGAGASITMKTWHEMVRVDINHPTAQKFADSLGLMGAYPSGTKVARDSQTVIEDNNVFGREWQVLASEPKLFHNMEGPQAPNKCEIPTKMSLRRKLSDSTLGMEAATYACKHIKNREEFDLCVFDVMATNNREVAHAY